MAVSSTLPRSRRVRQGRSGAVVPPAHALRGAGSERPRPGDLRALQPFERLTPDQLIVAAAHARLVPCQPGEVVLDAGADPDEERYLYRGEMRATRADGAEMTLCEGTAEAAQPLTKTRPSLYRVEAGTGCVALHLDRRVVAALLAQAPRVAGDETVEELPLDITQTRQFLADWRHDLRRNRLVLRVLPRVAGPLREAVASSHGRDRLAELAALDPALLLKLLRLANGPLFAGSSRVLDTSALAERLGDDLLRELIICHTMRDQTGGEPPAIAERRERVWSEAIATAALAEVIAERCHGLDPAAAWAAGLLAPCGALPVLEHARVNPAYQHRPELIDRACARMSARVSALLLEHCGVAREQAHAVVHASDWERTAEGTVDLTDVLIAASWHLGVARGSRGLPAPGGVPALTKIFDGTLDPDRSMAVIAEARQRQAWATAMLRGDD